MGSKGVSRKCPSGSSVCHWLRQCLARDGRRKPNDGRRSRFGNPLTPGFRWREKVRHSLTYDLPDVTALSPLRSPAGPPTVNDTPSPLDPPFLGAFVPWCPKSPDSPAPRALRRRGCHSAVSSSRRNSSVDTARGLPLRLFPLLPSASAARCSRFTPNAASRSGIPNS